jgi:hypothetical protein
MKRHNEQDLQMKNHPPSLKLWWTGNPFPILSIFFAPLELFRGCLFVFHPAALSVFG